MSDSNDAPDRSFAEFEKAGRGIASKLMMKMGFTVRLLAWKFCSFLCNESKHRDDSGKTKLELLIPFKSTRSKGNAAWVQRTQSLKLTQ